MLRPVERIDLREGAAPAWLRERLVGAVVALDPHVAVEAGEP